MPSGFNQNAPIQEPIDLNGAVNRTAIPWFTAVNSTLLNITSFGTTAQRPTKNLYIGQAFFDTTLGRPVWLISVNPITWVDLIPGGGTGEFTSLVITGNNPHAFLFSGSSGAVLATPGPTLAGELLIGAGAGLDPRKGTILGGVGISVSFYDGSFHLDASGAATLPGGNEGDVQFNSGGSFGGIDSFHFDQDSTTLSLGPGVTLQAVDPGTGGFIVTGRDGDTSFPTVADSITLQSGGTVDGSNTTTGGTVLIGQGTTSTGGSLDLKAGFGTDGTTRGNITLRGSTIIFQSQSDVLIGAGSRSLDFFNTGELYINNDPGMVGQVITSGGIGAPIVWKDVAGQTPTEIQSGETFTVQSLKQVLFAEPIQIDDGGSLVINGSLIYVDTSVPTPPTPTPPAGLNTQVQWNNSGAFGADQYFTYSNPSSASGVLTITGNAPQLTIGDSGSATGVIQLFGGNRSQPTTMEMDGAFALVNLNGNTTTNEGISFFGQYDFTYRTLGSITQAQGLRVTIDGAIGVNIATGQSGQMRSDFDYGTAGYVLTSGGPTATAVWAPSSGGSGSPAGSNTQIQYNASGVFGADATFAFDPLFAAAFGTAPTLFLGSDGGVQFNVYDPTVNNGLQLIGRSFDSTISAQFADELYFAGGTELSDGSTGATFSVLGGGVATGGSFNANGGASSTGVGGGILFDAGAGVTGGQVSFLSGASSSGDSGSILFEIASATGGARGNITFSATGVNDFIITGLGEWQLGVAADPGTAGQVLTSNGAGAAPTWSGGSGTATLVAGTIVVTTTAIQAGSVVQLTYSGAPTNPGFLYFDTIIAGTSFTINSTSGTDVSAVAWTIA